MSKNERRFKDFDESWIRLVKLAEKYFLHSIHGKHLEKLTQPQQVLMLIYEFNGCVLNGGIDQYFNNSSGDNTHETLEALHIIRAFDTFTLLQQAISIWPNGKVPKDREIRWDILDEIEDRAEPIWDECTRRFYDSGENIITLLYTYMDANENEYNKEDK